MKVKRFVFIAAVIALVAMFSMASFQIRQYSAKQLKDNTFVISEIVRIKAQRKAVIDKMKNVSPLQKLSLNNELNKMNMVLKALEYVKKHGYDPSDEKLGKLAYFQRQAIPSLPVVAHVQKTAPVDSKVYDISHKGIVPPKAIKKVDVLVPPELSKSGIQGVVKIRITVDEKGIPTDPHILEGLSDPINELVKKTIMEKWRFKPATLKGKPVKVYYRIAIPFDIKPGQQKAKS